MNRRSGLGRGLDSLIPAETDRKGSLLELPVSSIEASEQQPRERFEEEALVALTDSVRELGVLQPVLVREIAPDRYALIAGERRWRAARRAGLPSIPAVVREVDDQHSLEQALVENLHREDLNPMEEAAGYQRLIDEFALTQDRVATRVGRSRSAVANTLRLFQLPGSVQRRVSIGELSAGHARALLASPDRRFQEEMAERVVAEGLNVRQTEEIVRTEVAGAIGGDVDLRPTGASAPRVGETRPAGFLELEDRLGGHLETRVQVKMGKTKGRLTVEFADLEDLERIYRVMVEGSVPS